MTKKSPDKREQKRLKKVEEKKQSDRLRAAMMVKDGSSYRCTAKLLGKSHQFVSEWAHKLLDIRTVLKEVDGTIKKVREYELKDGYRSLLATKKPGPAPGICPKS